MVGIVVVSHSEKLAQSVVELAHCMAKTAKIVAAGGKDDGDFGTSYDKIDTAINQVYSDDGVVLICDLGSSVLTSKNILEDKLDEGKKIVFADCSIVEGAIAASVAASCGLPLETVVSQAEEKLYKM